MKIKPLLLFSFGEKEYLRVTELGFFVVVCFCIEYLLGRPKGIWITHFSVLLNLSVFVVFNTQFPPLLMIISLQVKYFCITISY